MGDRVAAEVLAMLHAVSVATLSSQLQRRGYRQLFMQGVAPLRPDLRMAGQAFTLRYIPAREDLEQSAEFNNLTNKQRIAVESVGPGDVLVIEARGDTRAGSLGNILATRIKQRGAAGIVTDGAFRDTPAIAAIDLPTYARGQHPNISLTFHHPVDINVPIGCGGVAVLPGDVVVGDGEGEVPLRQLERHFLKLPRNIKPKAVNDLDRKFKAMGAQALPIPKGPMPTRVPRR